MPLETVLGVSAPPRRFSSSWTQWFFLLMASEWHSVACGLLLGAVLFLPFLLYEDSKHSKFVEQLRPIVAEVRYSKTENSKNGERYHFYEILYTTPQGEAKTKKMETKAEIGCLRTSLLTLHTFCVKQDTVFYTEMPSADIIVEMPKMRPWYALYFLLPLAAATALVLWWSVRRRQKLLPILHTGLVVEATIMAERENRAYTQEDGKSTMLRREYNYTDYKGESHTLVQNIPLKKANALPSVVPVLYLLSDPKTAIIAHEAIDYAFPNISEDGIMRLNSKNSLNFIILALIVLAAVWFFFGKMVILGNALYSV